jgi:hypothetical protein
MNPNGGETKPQFEAPRPPAAENTPDSIAETGVAAAPEAQTKLQSVQLSSQVASDLALPSQAITSDDGVQTKTADNPQAKAADSDRIEKEWVDKAKSVIARTLDDPFTQKNEMSKVKAEYIKKRFNKTLKIREK